MQGWCHSDVRCLATGQRQERTSGEGGCPHRLPRPQVCSRLQGQTAGHSDGYDLCMDRMGRQRAGTRQGIAKKSHLQKEGDILPGGLLSRVPPPSV